MMNKTVSEQELIAGCKEGKAWAQKAIYDLYAPMMMGVCMRYIADRETVRDVLQEGFIKLFTKIDTYSGIGAFGGWVRRIFVTTALEYLRQQSVLKFAVNIDDCNEVFEEADYSVIDNLSGNDLMTCIAQLPEGYRTVFNLYAVEGYSHAEIGNILNITEGTSRSQYARARKQLQDQIRNMFS